MSYTAPQMGAIENYFAHNLIVALPGSGKSHTLTGLTKKALEANYSNSVLVTTFTNAAVGEMQHRLSKLLGAMATRTHVSTFHKLYLKQTKGLMRGRLLIGPAHWNFLERVKRELGLNWTVQDIGLVIDDLGLKWQVETDNKLERSIYDTYCRLKRENGMYDFNDCAKRAIECMASGEIKPLNYSHLFVDEFQDTDELQYSWIAEHARAGVIITAVGDDDQSIYSWRGAKGFEVMQRFQGQFEPTLHILNTCFRCRPEILFAAKNMIEFNAERVPKDMESGKEPGGIIEIIEHESNEQQYETFEKHYEEHSGQWAILCRTNIDLEQASMWLLNAEIPFTIQNTKSIWDRPEADFTLKLCYILLRPKRGVMYLSEVLGYLNVSEFDTQEVVAMASKAGTVAALIQAPQSHWGTALQMLCAKLNVWSQNTSSSEEIFSHIKELVETIQVARNGKIKGCNVESSLLNSLNEFTGSWHERLERFTRELFKKGDDKKRERESKGVILSTFHGSKGLEWNNVAIFDFVDGRAPAKSVYDTSCELTYQSRLAEERRLAFVAMTRAEERLYIHTYNSKIGAESASKQIPSPFIDEILYEED